MKRVWIERCKNNSAVTDSYLRAIGAAYETQGYETNYLFDLKDCKGSSDDIYVVAVAPSVLRQWLHGRKKIVYWAQGIWPEESYLKHRSAIRLTVCSLVEKTALVLAKKIFLVSRAQQMHYQKKYRIDLSEKSFVMACSNEVFHEDAFYSVGKYESPVFVYAGSLVKYQCIDEMLEAFRSALDAKPNATLLFYTSQIDEAKAKVSELGLCNVVVDYKPQSELFDSIAKAKYGFVIREDIEVNRVSTPTKISTYIASGIIPVYSKCLSSFEECADKIPKLSYCRETWVDDFLSFEQATINPDVILRQFKDYFEAELDYSRKTDELSAFLSR